MQLNKNNIISWKEAIKKLKESNVYQQEKTKTIIKAIEGKKLKINPNFTVDIEEVPVTENNFKISFDKRSRSKKPKIFKSNKMLGWVICPTLGAIPPFRTSRTKNSVILSDPSYNDKTIHGFSSYVLAVTTFIILKSYSLWDLKIRNRSTRITYQLIDEDLVLKGFLGKVDTLIDYETACEITNNIHKYSKKINKHDKLSVIKKIVQGRKLLKYSKKHIQNSRYTKKLKEYDNCITLSIKKAHGAFTSENFPNDELFKKYLEEIEQERKIYPHKYFNKESMILYPVKL